jgi:hypothetical protein
MCISTDKKISLLDQKSKPTTIIKHCESAVRFYGFFNYDEAAVARVVPVLTRPPSIAFLASDYYFFEKHRAAGLIAAGPTAFYTQFICLLHITQIRLCTTHFATGLAYIYNIPHVRTK